MGKRDKSKNKRRRRKSKDDTPETSVSIDLVEAEQKLNQEAHLRAEQRYKQLSQWTSLSQSGHKKKKKIKEIDLSVNDSSNLEEDDNEMSNNDESDDDFGLYKVSYTDLQNNGASNTEDTQKSTQTTSPTASPSASVKSSSLELLSSPNKRKRKRKRKSLSFDDYDSGSSDLEFMSLSQSPPRKRRKKNKTHKKKKEKEKDSETKETYNVFDDIDVSDSEINAVNLSGIMDNNTSITQINRKYESMINKIHAPIPSADELHEDELQTEDDEDVDIQIMKEDDVEHEEEKDDEQDGEEEEEEETILFKLNYPPPKQEKKISIKMKKSQSFGSIIAPLEDRFGMKVTLYFDGESISNTQTPQDLIDEFDAEDGDLIDANYK